VALHYKVSLQIHQASSRRGGDQWAMPQVLQLVFMANHDTWSYQPRQSAIGLPKT